MSNPDEPTVPNLPPVGPDGEATQAMAVTPGASAMDPEAAAEGDRSMRNGLIAVGALIAIALLALLFFTLGGDDDQDVTAGGASTTTSSSSSTTSTTEEATTTTEAPTTTAAPVTVPPTTAAPTTARPTTTATTFPASAARVTFTNDYPATVIATINGVTQELKPGETKGPFAVTPAANNNDVVEVKVKDDPTCGLGDADDKLDAGKAYRFRIVTAPTSGCGEKGAQGVDFRIEPM